MPYELESTSEQHPTGRSAGWSVVDRRRHEGSGSDPIGLRDWSKLLQRRRWLVLASFLICTLASIVAGVTLPEWYESDVTVLIQRQSDGVQSPEFEVLERLGRVSQAETEIELMTSRRVMTPVADQLDLNVSIDGPDSEAERTLMADLAAESIATPGEYQISQESGNVSVRDSAGRILAEGDVGEVLRFEGIDLTVRAQTWDQITLVVEPMTSVIEDLQDRVSASLVSPDADLIRLKCKAETAVRARELCDAVASNYLELRTELQRSEASATAAVLAEQAASVRKRLETAEDSLESFQTRNQLVAVADQVTEEVQALAALRVQREQLDAERVALTELVDAIGSNAQDSMRLRDVASFPTFLQNPVVSDLMSTLLELETERRELTLRRSEVNPDVVAIDQQIREVENQLRDYAVSYERALIAQVSALDRPLVAASDRLRTLPTQQVQLARLERQVTLLSNLFQYLESRRREAEVAEAVDLPSIRVVDSASQPTSPSWPSVPLLTVLGMAFGLAAGLGLAILRDWSDDRLYERSEVEADLGLQVIGLIPRIQKDRVVVPVNGRSTKLMPSRSFANRKTDSTAQADERERGQDTRQRADARIVQWSPGFEAFRSLMTDVRLLWPLKEHEQVRSIAVTSAGTGEGKTVIACNLAMAFAFQNERTILVDADLRARGASRAFGLASRPGLSDYLNGEVGIDEVMVNAAVGLGDLLVFPAGSTASLDSSAHLQASVAQLLKELGRRSEILIVDAPPLNVLADASSVSAAVDVVLVVIRSGVTTRESVQLTIDRLRRSGASQVGLILNDAPLPKQYASYSKNYHYREAGKGIIREDATP